MFKITLPYLLQQVMYLPQDVLISIVKDFLGDYNVLFALSGDFGVPDSIWKRIVQQLSCRNIKMPRLWIKHFEEKLLPYVKDVGKGLVRTVIFLLAR